MNIVKRAIVRFKFRMAKKLILSVDEAMAKNKSVSRADKRRFWNEFRKSPERRKAVVAELEKRIESI